jgi:hypothetical protein
MKNLNQFLKVNGKIIVFLNKDGVYWIALKPICQALGVDYIEQFKDTKSDSILGPALCKHTMQLPGDQSRSMVCLPEEYIYGWIFSLKSKNPELIHYKKECYHLLYQHFHGTITQRQQLLNERESITTEMEQKRETLKENPEYVRLNELQARNMRLEKDLRKLDIKLVNSQLTLFQ